MHGYPDWFGWLLAALYYGAYVLPALLVFGVGWWLVRRIKK